MRQARPGAADAAEHDRPNIATISAPPIWRKKFAAPVAVPS